MTRSVNDFDTKAGLRSALKHSEVETAFSDVGRDFPLALGGAGLDAVRDDDSHSVASSTAFEPETDLDWLLSNYDEATSNAQSLDQELNRLQVLKSYLILDSEREATFERLTGLAMRIFRVPIALVSLVDLGRQWFMSNRGLGDARETPRNTAFCAHAVISKEDILIVPDATNDPRFRENPLVTGPPHIRFYAGAPLLCPEGYRLGTLCVIDNVVRPEGLSLDERQTITELAALVIDAMVQRRNEKLSILQDKAQIIATTAHDLLTPLSGVQMSMSLLMDDKDLKPHLSSANRELIETASACVHVMNGICQEAIETFRGEVIKRNHNDTANDKDSAGLKTVSVKGLVEKINIVMDPFPKKVPFYISVDPLVPPEFCVANDLKVFRSAINYLTNALEKTEKGNVFLKLYLGGTKKKPDLIFHCEDTGSGIALDNLQYLFRPFRESANPVECIRVGKDGKAQANACHAEMRYSGLGLYSVANQISSLGGEYGYRRRVTVVPTDPNSSKAPGSIFWFSIPLIVPQSSALDGDTKIRRKGTSDSMKSYPAVMNDVPKDLTAVPSKLPNGTSASTKSDPKVMNNVPKAWITVPSGCSAADTIESIPESIAFAIESEPFKPAVLPAKVSVVDTDRITGIVTTALTSVDEQKESVTVEDRKRVRRSLVIDDSVVIRKSVGRALSRLGFEVDHAVNGLAGLRMLQQHVYDVVFCDYLMPVMDGLDCVQQYRDWESVHRPWFRQYIVGISAHASSSDVEKGMKAGMNDFKGKPVTMKHLQELEKSEKLVEVSKLLDAVLTLDVARADIDSEIIDSNNNSAQHRSEDGPVCLIAEPASNSVMEDIVRKLGWQLVHVTDGEDALRLMKMRNWNAVFIENELSRLTGTGCIARFRAWESDNRIASQDNVFLLSTDFVPSPSECVTAVYPSGFDGALGKPILTKDLKYLLQNAEERSESKSSSIVVR